MEIRGRSVLREDGVGGVTKRHDFVQPHKQDDSPPGTSWAIVRPAQKTGIRPGALGPTTMSSEAGRGVPADAAGQPAASACNACGCSCLDDRAGRTGRRLVASGMLQATNRCAVRATAGPGRPARRHLRFGLARANPWRWGRARRDFGTQHHASRAPQVWPPCSTQAQRCSRRWRRWLL